MKYELEPYHRNVSDEKLLADLKRVASELGRETVTRAEYDKHGQYSAPSIFKRFGKWDKALGKAGLQPSKPHNTPDEELLADLRRVASKLGRTTVSPVEYNKHGNYDATTLRRRFGEWNKALEKADLQPFKRHYCTDPSISDEELLTDVKRVASKLKRETVSTVEYDLHGNHNADTISRRFGKWNKALEKAGLHPFKRIPDEELLADLKRVASELGRTTVLYEEYSERGNYSAGAIHNRFGKWKKALEKAGLQPSNGIPEEELLADLKRVASELGQTTVSPVEYNKHGNYDAITLRRRFGKWNKALEKAGLHPFKRHYCTPSISDEELLTDLKRVASKLGRETVTREEYGQNGKYGATTFLRRFEKWNKTLEKAGLQPLNLQNIPEEELFKNLEEVWVKLGRQPYYGEMVKPLSKYSGGTYAARFKGWRNALKKFVAYVNEGGGVVSEETVKNLPIDPISKHKTKRRVNLRLRYLVLERDNNRCRTCGKSAKTDTNVVLEVDHIKPWSKGGETVMENLQILCRPCNSGKSNIE